MARFAADGFVNSEPLVSMVMSSNTLESSSESREVTKVFDGFSARLAVRFARPSGVASTRSLLTKLAEATNSPDIAPFREPKSCFHGLISIAACLERIRRVLTHHLTLGVS